MFFKIYFSRRKFEQDAAALVQKQNGWTVGAYCGARILSASPDEQYISPMEARARIKRDGVISAVNRIDAAREELLGLDTWDKYKQLCIDSKLKTVKDFLEQLVWKPVKRKEDK